MASWVGNTNNNEPAEPETPHYFRVDLSPEMRRVALAQFSSSGSTSTHAAIREALELAERIDTPYTPPVDWTALEKRAMLGYDVVDQIWDAKRKGATE